MSTYFIEYLLSDHKTRAFFGKISDGKSEEEARKIIMDGLKKAYGESLLDVEITKQNSAEESLTNTSKQKSLYEEVS